MLFHTLLKPFSRCQSTPVGSLSFNTLLIVTLSLVSINTYAEDLSSPPPVSSQEQTSSTAQSQPSSQLKDVAPFVAEYDLSTSSMFISGDGQRSLKHLGNGRYRMEQTAQSFLMTRREISEFTMKHCQIKPKSYRYEQSGVGSDKRHLIDFDIPKSHAIYEEKKQRTQIDIPKGMLPLDRLSETLALQCQLQSGAQEITLNLIDKDQLRQHKFKVVGQETIQVASSKVKVLKVERIRDDDNRRTTLWFAPQQNFQLMKMEQENDGKSITLELESIRQIF